MEVKQFVNTDRDRTKQKSNHYIDELKDGDDDVCGAVLDTLNNDYLSYITNLVKASKTPSKKKRTEDKMIQSLFENKPNQTIIQEEKYKQKMPPKLKRQSPQSESSIKNCTLPIKRIKGLSQGNSYREPHGTGFEQSEKRLLLNLDKKQLIRQHYNRFPTQEAEKPYGMLKNEPNSIIYQSEQSHKNCTHQNSPPKEFLMCLDQYLGNLQNNEEMHKKKHLITNNKHRFRDQIRDSQQLLQQNVKLRKKLRKYEQKMQQIQDNIQSHLINCKKKQKNQKNKINELIKSLTHAVSRINSQKQQIDTMKELFKNFGRKARFCAQNYQSESQDLEEEINQSLVRAMRPSRAHSDNKIKNKNPLTSNFDKFMEEKDT